MNEHQTEQHLCPANGNILSVFVNGHFIEVVFFLGKSV